MANGMIPKDRNLEEQSRTTTSVRTRTTRGRRGRGDVRDTGRQRRGVSFHMPYWMEWYDYVMIPIMVIAAIAVAVNIYDVLLFFFYATVWIIDASFFVLSILVILVMIWFFFGSRRRGDGRYGRYW